MSDDIWLEQQFEAQRPRLRSVAQRMLGSQSDADDAVQETWLRVSRAGTDGVENLGGWLTTIVSRVCLSMLRSRGTRREQSLDPHVADPIVSVDMATAPEDEAVLADSVGLALLVVLETLTPAERLAFVLHDMFAMPFDEIAAIIDRSPDATRQLASRARRRVQGAAPERSEAHRTRQRAIVDAFFAAARGGELQTLVSLLDPNVVLRADGGVRREAASAVVRGAEAVASRAIMFARPGAVVHPAMVNGGPGVVVTAGGRIVSVMSFTVAGDRIIAIEALADPERLAQLDLPHFE
jgi:RNA polymerase sigma-70 factor (ECF subfamily)